MGPIAACRRDRVGLWLRLKSWTEYCECVALMVDLGLCTRFDSQQLTVTDRIKPLISLLGHHAVQFEPSMEKEKI